MIFRIFQGGELIWIDLINSTRLVSCKDRVALTLPMFPIMGMVAITLDMGTIMGMAAIILGMDIIMAIAAIIQVTVSIMATAVIILGMDSTMDTVVFIRDKYFHKHKLQSDFHCSCESHFIYFSLYSHSLKRYFLLRFS